MNRPNILFFCTDQQRFDSLGCCGNQVAVTPNLDRIAAAGTRFTGHRTPCQICSPSRASMFTGRYPRNHGLVGNGIALDPAIPTLPAQLSAAGYRTHGVGKFHLQPILAPAELNLPESQAFWHTQQAASWQGPYYGFDTVELAIGGGPETTKAGHYARWLRDHHPEATELYGPESAIEPPPPDLAGCWKSAIPAEWHYNRWIADRASVYLQEVNDPFFLFVSFPDPHHPFAPPAPYCHQYDPQCLPAPRIVAGELQAMPPYYTEAAHPFEQGNLKRTDGLSEATLRQVIAHTYGTVSMLDDCVGRVMQTLEQEKSVPPSPAISILCRRCWTWPARQQWRRTAIPFCLCWTAGLPRYASISIPNIIPVPPPISTTRPCAVSSGASPGIPSIPTGENSSMSRRIRSSTTIDLRTNPCGPCATGLLQQWMSNSHPPLRWIHPG
jgi:arylsulfatase A-like enzyme